MCLRMLHLPCVSLVALAGLQTQHALGQHISMEKADFVYMLCLFIWGSGCCLCNVLCLTLRSRKDHLPPRRGKKVGGLVRQAVMAESHRPSCGEPQFAARILACQPTTWH